MYSDYNKSDKKTLNKYGIFGDTENNLNNAQIIETVTNYTKSGSKWLEQKSSTQTIPTQYYFNVVSSIPFFKNLGGTETVKRNYTLAGDIPTQIISISPDKTQKTVRQYQIIRA